MQPEVVTSRDIEPAAAVPQVAAMSTTKGKAAALLDPIEDEVFELIATGVPQKVIAERYGLHFNSILNWIKAGGEPRIAKHEAAKESLAEWHLEQWGEILDAAGKDTMPGEAAIIKEKARRHQWLAEKLNRQLYGDRPQEMNVKLDIGGLHLDALRQAGTVKRIESGPVVDAEVVTDE